MNGIPHRTDDSDGTISTLALCSGSGTLTNSEHQSPTVVLVEPLEGRKRGRAP
jgi:hypothetical protein